MINNGISHLNKFVLIYVLYVLIRKCLMIIKIWNRTQILDFDSSDNTVNLFYVDLGTWEEYVPINRLRHITDRFHQHQVFSIPCRLAHILPINNENDQVTWTDEATNQFIAVIDQVIPEVEFLSFGSNGCLHTNLFVINSDQPVCVNDYMIHIKQAKSVLNTTNIDDDEQTSIQVRNVSATIKRTFVHRCECESLKYRE